MNTYDDNEYIIKTPKLLANVNREGLGPELFYSMLKHKDNIMHIEESTGIEETFGQVLQRSVRVAIELRNRGITSNDLISLCTDNNLNYCVPFLAALFIGAKVAPLDPSLCINETKTLLKLIEPRIVFVSKNAEDLIDTAARDANVITEIVVIGDSDNNTKFSDFLKPCAEEKIFRPLSANDIMDTAVILFSSGTTGLPKGTCLNHYGLLSQVEVLRTLTFPNVNHVFLNYSSICWISTVNFLIGNVQKGDCRLLCTEFKPEIFWDLVGKYKITSVFLAPCSLFNVIKIDKPPEIDISSIKIILTGGAPISADQILYVRQFFPDALVSQGYGQTEVSGMVAVFNPNKSADHFFLMNKPGSCGRPCVGQTYKVVNPENGELLGPFGRGELMIKSPFIMNGYFKTDSSSFFDQDGFFKTGDIIYYDNDRCFYHVDRINEMLRYKNCYVLPNTLEEILLEHEEVLAAVVIGIPHPEDGHHPMGVVVLKNDKSTITPKEIEDFVNAKVDDKKKLRAGVKFIKELPMTPTAKVRRILLRDQILAGIL